MPRNWLPIKDYEGLYEVSDQGEIRRVRGPKSKEESKILIPSLHSVNGYPRVALSKNNVVRRVRVHKIVLETFVGPRELGQCARHLNDDRQDNRLDNLKWGSYKENYMDSHKNGVWRPRGPDTKPRPFIEKHFIQGKKLHITDIPKIKAMTDSKSNKEIAEIWGINASNVSRILNGKRWIYT